MRFIKYLLLLFLITMFLSGCRNESGIILDVREVINKTPAEVENILGKPDTTYTESVLGKQIFCQRYSKNNIEIQYPEGLSTDVVVYGPHGLPFTQSALKAFNIKDTEKHPSQYERDAVMRWYDFNEFAGISFYNVEKDSLGAISNYTIFFKAKGH